MYKRNRNLFSFLAVLFTAGLIAGIGGIFLLLANQVGSGPSLVANTPINGDNSDLPNAPTSETIGIHEATVLSVATNERTSIVASGSYDNTVRLWNRDREEDITLSHSGRVNDIIFTPNSQQIVTGSGAGVISLWSLSGELQSAVKGGSGRILSLAVDSQGKTIASGSSKGTLQLWSLEADEETNEASLQTIETLTDTGSRINALAFHPTDQNILVSGSQDGLIQVWDINQPQPIQTLDDSADRIVSITISSNGQYLASGSYDQSIRIWDLETGDLLQTLDGHDFVVADVAFNPEGTVIASSSYDESIKTWDWNQGRSLCTLEGHSGFVYSITFADSGNTLVSGGYDGTVRTWDLTAATKENCLPK